MSDSSLFFQPPFRTRLARTSGEEMRSRNRLRSARGLEPLPAAADLLGRLEEVKTASSQENEALLTLAAEHPDERVLWKTAHWVQELSALRYRRRRDLRPVLLHAAQRNAARDGVLWTPLLDSLFVRWGVQGEREIEYDGAPILACVPCLSEVVREIGDWVARQQEPAALHAVACFRASPLVVETSARLLRLDAHLVRSFAFDPETWAELFRRPRPLAPGAAEVAQRLALEMLRGGSVDPLYPESVLVSLALQGTPLLPEVRAYAQEVLARSLEAESGVEDRRASLMLRLWRGADPATQEMLYRWALAAGRRAERVERLEQLAYSHAAGPELRRRLLREHPHPAVRHALAGSSDSRWDPEMRTSLFRRLDSGTAALLIGDARQGEFGRCLRRLLREDARQAARALGEASAEQVGSLSRRDWARLLQHSEPGLRMAAIQAQGRRTEGRRV